MKELREVIYKAHDIDCNQKYNDNLPYSFHLSCVENQGFKFFHLLQPNELANVHAALICHDAIEDARLTYNDVKNTIAGTCLNNSKVEAKVAADIVYCVTDEKGKSRAQRKNDQYYKELKANDLAVFVKLADLAANKLFSKLTASSMYEKYQKEWPKFKAKLYIEKYSKFFDYVESI